MRQTPQYIARLENAPGKRAKFSVKNAGLAGAMLSKLQKLTSRKCLTGGLG